MHLNEEVEALLKCLESEAYQQILLDAIAIFGCQAVALIWLTHPIPYTGDRSPNIFFLEEGPQMLSFLLESIKKTEFKIDNMIKVSVVIKK